MAGACRILVMASMLLLLWCQVAAAAHACAMAMSTPVAREAAAMASMPGRDDANAAAPSREKAPCPSYEATPDWGKFPVF